MAAVGLPVAVITVAEANPIQSKRPSLSNAKELGTHWATAFVVVAVVAVVVVVVVAVVGVSSLTLLTYI